jgi:hypothetical protein
MRPRVVTLFCTILFAAAASATTFIVPTDEELIAKSNAIAIGTVEGAYVQELDGIIETVYEIRVEQSLKALPMTDLLRVVSPGGILGDRGLHVEAAAHFEQGEHVLLFLTRHKGRWTTTDLTLGKFRFVTSTKGDELLVRDMEDVVGWDQRGNVHHEQVRRRDGFLQFVREKIKNKDAKVEHDYIVDASEVTLPPPERRIAVNAPFPGTTYTSWVNNQPTRWPNISAGVTFRKVASQNISGLSDGGVSVIQNGLAAWNNECGSVINLIYGGTTSTGSTNFDSVHVVEFNDPQNRISGSWTGSGTIGICFNSFSGSHSFGGTTWLSISDADVVFQNGFPGTHPAFPTAMTHELGHGIGWRHSNQHYNGGGACNSSQEECTSAAIMNSSVNANYGYTLQPWDVNAAQSVYPGGTCDGPTCTPPTVSAQPQGATVNAGTSRTLSVSVTGTAPFTYQWYIGTSGNLSNPISGANGPSIVVTPSSTTSYFVRISNSCGTINSATATITVNAPPPSNGTRLRTDFDGDGRSDLFWRNTTSGANAIWFMNGNVVRSTAGVSTVSLAWQPVAFGDFNGDGRSDIFWRNANGTNVVWLMNGASATEVTAPSAASGWNVDASGDFNNDGRWDLFWRNASSGANQIWHMNGASPSVSPMPTVSPAWVVGTAGDFDGNGRYDIFWRNAAIAANVLWLNPSSGLQEVTIQAVAASWAVQGSGDFNGDGRSDVFWRQAGTGFDVTWLMNGSSHTEVALPTVATSWSVGAIGDFNGNATYDVAWRNVSGANAMWLMSNARVSSETALPAVGGWQMYGVK